MIPAYARIAHKKMRQRLADIARWNDSDCDLNRRIDGSADLGIITSGVSFTHVREAAPDTSILKITVSHPLPIERMRAFAHSVKRCVVIEEGDPYLVEACAIAGIAVTGKPDMYRFGELNVNRVRRILANDTSPEPAPAKGKPPQLCQGCPHRKVFEILSKLDCIVSGDIGCYTLGVLPPFEAMDSCICMGASISAGLGMRHAFGSSDDARRVVSVIGDSTFVHSGITGLVDMAYNPPPTGHVVIILDNGTTAMTGLQEHPGTGRSLTHAQTHQLNFEKLITAIEPITVHTIDVQTDQTGFEKQLTAALASNDLTVLIARRPCILAAKKIKQYQQACS